MKSHLKNYHKYVDKKIKNVSNNFWTFLEFLNMKNVLMNFYVNFKINNRIPFKLAL